MASLELGTYCDIPEVDYTQPPLCTWQEFYDFRNHVLRVLRRFGSVGPMGEVDLSVVDEDSPAFESGIVDEPDFFVVDDMYNEHDRLSIVECDVRLIRNDLIEALCEMERNFPDWWVHFSLGDSGLRISSDRMLYGGRRFWDCKTVTEIVERCARPVDFGPEEPLSEEMYLVWLAVVSGQFGPSSARFEPPTRQWVEILRSLDDLRLRKRDGRLSRFDYNRIQQDIHPKTRRELVLRLLGQIEVISAKQLEEAHSNLAKDLRSIFLDSDDPQDRAFLANQISRAQTNLRSKIPPKDLFFWWPNIVHRKFEQPSPWRDCLVGELQQRVNDPDPSFQLSAVFSLALLRVEKIAELVDAVLIANPGWLENAELLIWLERMKVGSHAYPGALFLP